MLTGIIEDGEKMNLQDNFSTSQKILSLLSETPQYPQHTLQKAIHYLHHAFAHGYDPTDMNYFLFNHLIEKEGLPRSVVYPFLKELVSHEKFIPKEDDTHLPTQTVMTYLAGASYWFDAELFKENSTDKNLGLLVEIGCRLIQKGFRFPDLDTLKNPEIVHYMHTYIQKVHQQNQPAPKGIKGKTGAVLDF